MITLMVRLSWLKVDPGTLYIIACACLAAVWLFPSEPRLLPMYALVVATLPTGVLALNVTYLGSLLLVGPDQDPVFFRIGLFAIWVSVAILQVFTVRVLLTHRRCNRAQ